MSAKRLHSPKCASHWIKMKSLKMVISKRKFFVVSSFSMKSTLSKLSNPAYTSSSFWGFVICFGLGLCVDVGVISYQGVGVFFTILCWSFSTSSPHHPPLPTSNCPLVTYLWQLHICSLPLPHFTPEMSVVSFSPLFHQNMLLYVLSWQDQQINNKMYLSLGTK